MKEKIQRLVYTINLDKRNEKGVPAVLETGTATKLDPYSGVLKIYISIIENHAETNLAIITLAASSVGLENVKDDLEKEWEKKSEWPNKINLEI